MKYKASRKNSAKTNTDMISTQLLKLVSTFLCSIYSSFRKGDLIEELWKFLLHDSLLNLFKTFLWISFSDHRYVDGNGKLRKLPSNAIDTERILLEALRISRKRSKRPCLVLMKTPMLSH
jgi:hypothetical protein